MASSAATSFTARRKDPTGHTLRMRGAAQRTHTQEVVPTSLLAPGVWDTHSGRGLSLLAPGVWDTLPQGGGSREARQTFNKIQ